MAEIVIDILQALTAGGCTISQQRGKAIKPDGKEIWWDLGKNPRSSKPITWQGDIVIQRGVVNDFHEVNKVSGGPISAYMALTGCNFLAALKDLCGGEMTATPRNYEIPEETKMENLAPAEHISKVYKALYKILSLSPEDRGALEDRGFEQTYMFRSLPKFKKDERVAIAHRLMNQGLSLKGVPGFYMVNGTYQLAYMSEGILVPYFDHNGNLVRFQIRKRKVKKGDMKYDTFSSSKPSRYGKTEGCSKATVEAHYATRFVRSEDGSVSPVLGKQVILTEGAMKAQLIHEFLLEPVIAIPGVGMTRLVEREAAYLKSEGVSKVILAFDMDYSTNSDVQKALRNAMGALKAAGLEVTQWKWDPNYKGLDDYLAHKIKGIEPKDR